MFSFAKCQFHWKIGEILRSDGENTQKLRKTKKSPIFSRVSQNL